MKSGYVIEVGRLPKPRKLPIKLETNQEKNINMKTDSDKADGL
jgi:hypothetical protein